MSRRRTRSGTRSDYGASSLEFAVVAMFVLLPLLFGMLEFGFAFQGQLAVTHAAREGARLAAVQNGALYSPAVVEQRAAPLTIADGLSIVRTEPDANSVRVTVSYPWRWRIMPFGEGFTLTSSATMRKE